MQHGKVQHEMSATQNTKTSATWKDCSMKKCNSEKVQHEWKSAKVQHEVIAAWSRTTKGATWKKVTGVKYFKKVHQNSALECTNGNRPSVDGPLYTG